MLPRGKSDPPFSANHVHESAGYHLPSRVRSHDHDPLVLSHRENSKQFGLAVWKTGDVIDWSSRCSELLHVFKSNVPIDLTVPIAGDSCSNRYRVSIVRDACDYPTLLDTSTSLDLIAIQQRY
jgi:hypothetical protein